MEITHVRHSKLRVECCDDALHENFRGSHEYDVIDVEEQVSHAQGAMKHEQGGVELGT
jgi:hypothetical protein